LFLKSPIGEVTIKYVCMYNAEGRESLQCNSIVSGLHAVLLHWLLD